MKEIKVEKDVVLSDSNYYLNALCDKIDFIWESLDFTNKREESFGKAYDLFSAKAILRIYTCHLGYHISLFNIDSDYDIDTIIKYYNNACNEVIRKLINKERT